MLNEWQEFLEYTGPVTYKADSKKDTSWLGRFTFEALRDFSGLSRILTILARGFLFHVPDGVVLDGQGENRLRPPGAVRLVQCAGAGGCEAGVAVSDGFWPAL